MVESLRKLVGLDGPVAYTFLARLVNIAGSTGTVLLIVRFLSPIEQGYYYTLLSLVSLQVVFELGFSFVIQQLAAHECIRLQLNRDGSIIGDPVAHARLASTLQLTVRWYTIAAAAMALLLVPAGALFFAHHAQQTAPVRWQGPWTFAALASAVGLWCLPLYSFLEGCGQIRAVAAMRLRQAVAASVFAWAAMILHHGLYSPALVIVGQVATGLFFLYAQRALLKGLLRHRPGGNTISWNREVWPFQWRIAVSWMCSYFTVQIFIPMLFALRGAVEAGQMGMSLSITGYMASLALTWSSTKITPYGSMVARREFHGMDRLFKRTLAQSLAVFVAMGLAAMATAELLVQYAPRLAARIIAPSLLLCLIAGAAATCIVQNLANLLRSFKNEPFLFQSLLVAGLTLLFAAATAPRWGNTGAAWSYFGATAGLGLPVAVVIFARARKVYLGACPIFPCEDVAL